MLKLRVLRFPEPPSERPVPDTVKVITEAELWLEGHEAPRGPRKVSPSNPNLNRHPSETKTDEDKEDFTDSALRRPSRPRHPRDAFKMQVQNLLNKLTMDNFKKLSEQIVSTLKEAQTLETLEDAVIVFHRKVLSDTKFCVTYAELLSIINKNLEPLKDPSTSKPVTFRATCLNKCQEVFESTLVPPTPQEMPDDEERNRVLKSSLSNLIFLGELCKIGLLPPKLLMNCFDTLLAKVKHGIENRTPVGLYQAEINSEKLSKALILSASSIAQKEMFQFQLQALVYEVEQLTKFPDLPPRNFYLLMDIVDAAKNNWVRRKVIEGPQTINDLHTKAYLISDPNMNTSQNSSRPTESSPSETKQGTPTSGSKRTVLRRVVQDQEYVKK